MRRRNARLALAGLLSVLCATSVASTAAGGAEPSSDIYEVTVYLHSATRQGKVLSLEIFPAEGVAVARTFYGGSTEVESGVFYSIAIPVEPFDGSLDLHFPGLGEVVGTVTPDEVRGPAAEAKLCEEREPTEYATFEGHISFHGAGDPRRWEATRVKEASISPGCGAHLERKNGPGSLFHHLDPGPGFRNDFIRFFANTETRTRRTQFAAVGDLGGGENVTLLAYDTEWLGGQIATQRWVDSHRGSFAKAVHFPRDRSDPSRIAIAPSAPFFGRGTYRKRTGTLTGSLGVHFPGLKLRLAHPPAKVIFEDEEQIAKPSVARSYSEEFRLP